MKKKVTVTILLLIAISPFILYQSTNANNKDYYAAIAFSPENGRWGAFYLAEDLEIAKKQALNTCKERGGKECQIVSHVKNGYACVNQCTINGEWGAAQSDKKDSAMLVSLLKCVKKGGDKCRHNCRRITCVYSSGEWSE